MGMLLFISQLLMKWMHTTFIVNIISSLHSFQVLVLLPKLIEITSFVCNSRINICLRLSSDRVVIVAKEFLNLPNMVILIKRESLTFKKLGSRNFWRTANSVPNKSKSAFPHLVNGLKTLILTVHIFLYLVSLLKLTGKCIIFL